MNIYCYKYTPTKLELVGVIDDYSSFYFKRSYAGIGEWSMVLNANTLNAQRVKNLNIIQVGNKIAGLVTNVHIRKDASGKSNKVTIKGIELKGITKQRIVIPNVGADELTYNNTASAAVIQGLLNTQLINPQDTGRKLALAAFNGLANGTAATYYNGRFQNVADEITNIATAYGVGWYADIQSGIITFGTFAGVNRTQEQANNQRVLLSFALDNLDDTDISYNQQWMNLAYVAGQGEGAARTILKVNSNAAISNIDRYEMYVDARDINTTDELTSRGKAKLGEIGDYTTYQANLSQLLISKYRTQFDLGDIVTIFDEDLPEGSIDIRLTEIEEVYESNNYKVNVKFGYDKQNLESAFNRIKNTTASINAM